MPKARCNGVELFYEVSGAGQPVQFIPGGYDGEAESAVVSKLPPEVVGILPQERRCGPGPTASRRPWASRAAWR